MHSDLAAPEMRLIVRPRVGGWVIQGVGDANGPFPSRGDTIELAEGMAQAMRESGAVVDLVIED
jgi:hypothetical protein